MTWEQDIRSHFPDWGTCTALGRWKAARTRLSIGLQVRGEVIARAPFGVWVDIHVGHPALLLVTKMTGADERRIAFEEYPQVGATVEAHIYSLGNDAEISLAQNHG
jgi:hypothetical protein